MGDLAFDRLLMTFCIILLIHENLFLMHVQIQKILGHEQIDTTLRYAMVNQNNVKMSHGKYISQTYV